MAARILGITFNRVALDGNEFVVQIVFYHPSRVYFAVHRVHVPTGKPCVTPMRFLLYWCARLCRVVAALRPESMNSGDGYSVFKVQFTDNKNFC